MLKKDEPKPKAKSKCNCPQKDEPIESISISDPEIKPDNSYCNFCKICIEKTKCQICNMKNSSCEIPFDANKSNLIPLAERNL